MSSSADKSSTKSPLSVQAIVLAGVVWGVLALLFFLLFSISPSGGQPVWYSIGTTIFELVSFLAAALLCFRNWRSPQILSGRTVWLGIGLGMLSYFIGGVLFSYWEIALNQAPAVSPGDLFYVLTYLFLAWGMIQAIVARRLSLELWQWGTLAVIAVAGALLAWVVSTSGPAKTANIPQSFLMQTAFEQPAIAAPAQNLYAQAKTNRTPAKPAPAVKPAAKPTAPATAAQSPVAKPTAPAASPAATAAPAKPAPEWATNLEAQLAPLEPYLSLFYIVSDLLLLIIATTLLLAFWGGRSSQSWRMIAAAAFSLYIADMWFKYANNVDQNYISGSLPEVFWVFSGVLFGIGAALEYDSSNRSRSRTGRRRGAA